MIEKTGTDRRGIVPVLFLTQISPFSCHLQPTENMQIIKENDQIFIQLIAVVRICSIYFHMRISFSIEWS